MPGFTRGDKLVWFSTSSRTELSLFSQCRKTFLKRFTVSLAFSIADKHTLLIFRYCSHWPQWISWDRGQFIQFISALERSVNLLMFIKGCCFFRELKGCQTAFLLFLCYLTFLFTNNCLREMPQRNSKMCDQQTFCFFIFLLLCSGFSQTSFDILFCSNGTIFFIDSVTEFDLTLNCPLKAPLHPSLKPCRLTLTKTKSQGLCITQSSA